MSRLLCLILLSLGLVQSAMAEKDGDRVSAYLTQKFGLGQEKRRRKYPMRFNRRHPDNSLPPALLLAIISDRIPLRRKRLGTPTAQPDWMRRWCRAPHRGLLRNVKDLTEPTANIEVEARRFCTATCARPTADENAALKSCGGSLLYALKVSLRAGDFAGVATPQDSIKNLNAKTDACDAHATGRCFACARNASNGGAVAPANAAGANTAAANVGASGAVVSAGLAEMAR